MATKKTQETKKTVATKTAEKKAPEKKVEKVVFDKKAFFTTIQKAFAKSAVTDVVADTEREKSINAMEYEYIHFYRKGTDRNIFQLYVKNTNSVFVVGIALAECLAKSDKFTVYPIKKPRTMKDGTKEKRITCYAITCKHEDTVEVSNILLTASAESVAKKASAKEEKKTEKKSA